MLRRPAVSGFRMNTIFPGLHGCLAVAIASWVGSLLIIRLQTVIDIFLQFFDAAIDLLAEGDLVKLFEDSAVKSFTDTIGLR